MRVIHVVTVPQTLNFFRGQLRYMQAHGLEMHVASHPGAGLWEFGRTENVPVHSVPMTRSISPLRDLLSLFRLIWLFLCERPDIVHAHTPKAGLLAMIAARLTCVPGRLFHLHGLPHSTCKGWSRRILAGCTKLSCLLSDRVLCVSHSVRDAAIAEGLLKDEHAYVPSHAGINGVDAEQTFRSASIGDKERARMRLGVEASAIVVGFAGRLVRDKGVSELAAAWQHIREDFPAARLLIAGQSEERDALSPAVIASLKADPQVLLLGQVKDMRSFYECLDLLVLPSHREGLPTVVLEASAMAVPVVTTDAVGCIDSVVDGVTGTIVSVGDSSALASAMRRYLQAQALRELHGSQGRLHALQHWKPEQVWASMMSVYQEMRTERVSKRWMDIAVAALLAGSFLPLFAGLSLLVRLFLGSPIFFRQQRPGLHGGLFTMYKFRTMREAYDEAGNPLPDSERLTRFGRFLRSTSLDELPELWNVLKGDMSLVGPRPLLPEYLLRYTDFQRRRHEVKPGITGWAQIHGRNSLNWEERFALDVWYVEHRTFWLDLKILWRTLITVCKREGIAEKGHVSMSKFEGSAY